MDWIEYDKDDRDTYPDVGDMVIGKRMENDKLRYFIGECIGYNMGTVTLKTDHMEENLFLELVPSYVYITHWKKFDK